MRMLTVDDLSAILSKSIHSVRSDVHRNPDSLPPLTPLPGTRRLLWHPDDVDAWLRRHSNDQKQIPQPQQEPARRRGRPTKTEQVARAQGASQI